MNYLERIMLQMGCLQHLLSLKQEDLAKFGGVSRPTIIKILSGQMPMTKTIMLGIFAEITVILNEMGESDENDFTKSLVKRLFEMEENFCMEEFYARIREI